MLTVVPVTVAEELVHNRRVEGYNNLPQINKGILNAIREYMTDNVGYNNLPMACLRKVNQKDGRNGGDGSIFTKLPVNSKDSILFQLDMPDDMIVSVGFGTLLDASNSADGCSCDEELELVQDYFKDELSLGISGGEADQILFIPFLALDRCRFYAKFDKDFNTEEYDLPGLEKMDIRELSSFIN